MTVSAAMPSDAAAGVGARPVLREHLHPAGEIGRHVRHLQAEEVADLGARNQDGNAVREADDHGPWQELDRGPHSGRAEDHEHDPGHHRAHEEAADAVLRDDAGYDDDERTGRSADLAA